jgi:predicted Zn-dependent peptidase
MLKRFAIVVATFISLPLGGQEFQLDVQERTLANGLQVLVHERPAAGRVGARIFTRVDIAAERPGIWGATHALEHSLFKGSRYIGTQSWEEEREVAHRVEILARQVEDERNRIKDVCRVRQVAVPGEVEPPCSAPRLDSLLAAYEEANAAQEALTIGEETMAVYQFAGGTGITASTGRDWMKFDVDLPADKLELFMWVERSRLEHPVFRQFDPEREVVFDQIRRGFNRPDGRFERSMTAMTYEAHPYGQAHWFSDLQAQQREDHWEIFYKNFIPQNTILVLVGEVEAEEVFSLAERYFGDWKPGRPSPRLRTLEPEAPGERRLLVSAPAGPTVAINARIPGIGHPDVPAIDVLIELLGGSDGLIMYSLGDLATQARVHWFRDRGHSKYPSNIEIRVDAHDNDELPAVEARLDRLFRQIALGETPSRTIDRAVAELRLRLLRDFEEIGPSAVRIGSMHAIFNWQYLNDLPRLWGEVTAEDLARLARAYLAPERRIVGLLHRTEAVDDTDWAELSDGMGPVRAQRDVLEVQTATASPAPISSSPSGRSSGGEQLKAPSGEENLVPFVPEPSGVQPLEVAEQVWWAPTWMQSSLDGRWLGSDVPVDHRDLDLGSVVFEPPSPEEYRVIFENGLRAFVVQDSYLPIIKVSALIDVSPLEDPAGKEGLTDLVIQLMRHGGTAGRPAEEVDSLLATLGASVATTVGRDVARFDLIAPSDAADQAVTLLAELLAQPAFDEVVLNLHRERAAVRAERATDEPRELVNRTFETALYGHGHAISRRPSRESVTGLTQSDVVAHHRQAFGPERIAFAVSGEVEAARVQSLISDAFSTAVDPDAAPKPPRSRELGEVFNPAGRIVRKIDREGLGQGHVLMGHVGVEHNQDDAYALELVHYVLCGGGFVSRMMYELRTRTGITSALFCHLEPGLGIANPYAWRFSGRPATLAEGIAIAIAEIEKMRSRGISADELENARSAYVEGYIPAAYDTPHKSMTRMAFYELLGRYPYTQAQYLNYYAGDHNHLTALRAVTLEDANRAARKYLDPDNIVITVVGPIQEILDGASGRAKTLIEQP